MPALQRRTPVGTPISIKSFTVVLEDETTHTVTVQSDGEGFLREEEFVGAKGSFRTWTVFVADSNNG